MMQLRLFLPSRIYLETEALAVKGESLEGGFTLLPRHIDMATVLIPGLLSYVTPDEEELFVAVDAGILVKRGESVLVTVKRAVSGELGALEEEVRRIEEAAGERERATRAAMARLEAGFVRGFLEFGK
ncbi:F0F1 ATP synthase subunit epsilon [Desulfovibrio mangrovi]|uniref:F0F1 ATP synthase subunit epsilon n=1 Tax=Desulfovibrio mangrovi TaxID=2976983 RepID=UPI00224631A0|nr:F0F1 ATP synthase subunit epsilon [Desulfovibrio mangrovi]UZP68808.1 F0F1 ATP synthase subunit epsilon [Desulfovibrio mangrovi]